MLRFTDDFYLFDTLDGKEYSSNTRVSPENFKICKKHRKNYETLALKSFSICDSFNSLMHCNKFPRISIYANDNFHDFLT